MSMNSFSFRAEKLARSSETSSENSEGIDAFTSPDPEEMQNFLQLKNLNFEPVDLSKLQKGWKDPAGAGRRAAPRFKIQFTVLIANHQKAFRSVSENISATGILLKDILPIEFCDSTFDIVLVRTEETGKKSFFHCQGKAVTAGLLRTGRVHFQSVTRETQEGLREIFQGLKPISSGKKKR